MDFGVGTPNDGVSPMKKRKSKKKGLRFMQRRKTLQRDNGISLVAGNDSGLPNSGSLLPSSASQFIGRKAGSGSRNKCMNKQPARTAEKIDDVLANNDMTNNQILGVKASLEVPLGMPLPAAAAGGIGADKKLINKKKEENLLNSKSAAVIKPVKDGIKPRISQSKEQSLNA